MRGVDAWPLKESYERIGRKAHRRWPRMAWFLIDMAVSNAYVLYARYVAAEPERRPSHPAAASQMAFRRALMNALVGSFGTTRKRGRPSHAPEVRVKAEEQHLPIRSMQQRPRVVCALHHSAGRSGHQPRTTQGCETCGVAVHFACWRAHLPDESRGDETE